MPTQSRVKQKGEKKVIFSHLRLISSPKLDFPLCCPTYSCPAAADNEDAAQDDNEEFRNAAQDDHRLENEEARP